MAAEPSSIPTRLVLLVLVALVPVSLGAGWLVGRLQGPPAPPSETAVLPEPDRAPTPVAARPTESVASAAPREEKPREEPRAMLSEWTGYQQALQQSQATGKPIMLDFNAEWCGPCRRLKENVFDEPVRAHDVQLAVIPVSIVDRRQEDGQNPAETEMLQARFNVHVFPTVVIFDPASGHSEQQRGFGGAEDMVQWIQETARRVK